MTPKWMLMDLYSELKDQIHDDIYYTINRFYRELIKDNNLFYEIKINSLREIIKARWLDDVFLKNNRRIE